MSLKTNLNHIQTQVYQAAKRANRNPRNIQLVVAGKYADIPKTQAVIQAGVRIIGENREQNLKSKFQVIGHQVDWHFIGHLQCNKVKSVITMVSLIHSLDSLRLAKELEKRLHAINKQLPVLIEVNTSGKKTKFGLSPKQTINLAEHCSRFKYLQVAGLMTMGALTQRPEANRQNFKALKKLANQIQSRQLPGIKMKYLSMGTSQDFEIAIEEGATFIRLGRAIFK